MSTWLIALYLVVAVIILRDSFEDSLDNSLKAIAIRLAVAVFWPLILAFAAVAWFCMWVLGLFANKWWFDMAVILPVFSCLVYFTLFF